jgi:hypothetical protein
MIHSLTNAMEINEKNNCVKIRKMINFVNLDMNFGFSIND